MNYHINQEYEDLYKEYRRIKVLRTLTSLAATRPKTSIWTPNLYSIHNNSCLRSNKVGGFDEQV